MTAAIARTALVSASDVRLSTTAARAEGAAVTVAAIAISATIAPAVVVRLVAVVRRALDRGAFMYKGTLSSQMVLRQDVCLRRFPSE
jgi:hypothetical protein